MKKINNALGKGCVVFLAMSLFFFGCVESYMPQFEEYKNILVVYGEISNQEGPYEVTLRRSSELNKEAVKHVNNARVEIFDTDGEVEVLEEIGNGVYRTNNLQGEVGKTYYLKVTTDDGNVYQSTPEKILEPKPIDSIYFEYEQQNDDQGDMIKIKINSHFAIDENHYMKYTYDEVWKFAVPFVNQYDPEGYNKNICWQSAKTKDLRLKSTAGLTDNNIQNLSIAEIGEDSYKMDMQYSINIKQQFISEQQYHYWESLKETSFEVESLFGTIPFSVSGNIYCINDSDIPVLGYFAVSGVTEKRFFLERSQIPSEFTPTSAARGCEIQYVDTANHERRTLLEATGWTEIAMDCHPEVFSSCDLVYFFVQFRDCYDCTTRGINVKPDFWPDDY